VHRGLKAKNDCRQVLLQCCTASYYKGVLVQNHTEILGTTEWIGPPQQPAHGCAPLKLQDHGDKVSFRNIWVRKLD
jgi:hypothetical protein